MIFPHARQSRRSCVLCQARPESSRRRSFNLSSATSALFSTRQRRSRWLDHQSDSGPIERSVIPRSSGRERATHHQCFSLSTFGSSMFSFSSLPSNALMNAFLKTFMTVVITSGAGSSKLPESGTRVPNRSLG